MVKITRAQRNLLGALIREALYSDGVHYVFSRSGRRVGHLQALNGLVRRGLAAVEPGRPGWHVATAAGLRYFDERLEQQEARAA